MRISVLLVIFLALLVVFSAYSVAFTQGFETESRSTVTVATYSLQGSYGYVAALRPNPLYNATTLSLGQGTLFVAITKSINVTYSFTVSLSQAGDTNLGASYLMLLSGGAWNKTLGQSSQSTKQTGTNSATFSRSFLVNVTRTVALAREIGNELQVPTPSYLVQIRPVVTGSLVEGGSSVPLYFVAPMNLTFSGGIIAPTGTSYFHQGNITSEVDVSHPSAYTYRYVSYGLLAGSLALLAVGIYYILRVEKRERPAIDELAVLTRPYMEVIAATSSLPKGESQVVMEKWEDLVKVADTLGKPILEFVDKGQGFTRYLFWVLDGQTTYVYEGTSKPNWAS